MKRLRWFLTLMILGLSSSVALADGIDPAIGVKGGGDETHWPGTVTLTITSNNFSSESFFINEGDANINNFLLVFDTEQGPFTALEGSAFPTVDTIVEGFVAKMSGGTIFPACFECFPASNEIFGNFFFEMQGVTLGSNGETKVTITSNSPVPEPGTLVLMLTGFGVMGLRRLRRSNVPS